MRAADAAKNTAQLIQDTMEKVKSGSNAVGKTNEEFSKVASGSSKMVDLVTEIAAASNEQAHGIGQISKAVNDMDRVVQQNAANAEESASASKELHGQAQLMQTFIARLMSLVKGAESSNGTGRAYDSVAKKLPVPVKSRSAAKVSRVSQSNGSQRKDNLVRAGHSKSGAAAVIPFDGEDMSDF